MLAEGKTYKEVGDLLGFDEIKIVHCEMSTYNYHVSYDSSPEDWVSPEFVYDFEEHKATLLSPELIREIKKLTDPEIKMLLQYVEEANISEEEYEWAADKFAELQAIAHGL
jgi:two-component SAPR family response regulator